jgi:hypothetical protein
MDGHSLISNEERANLARLALDRWQELRVSGEKPTWNKALEGILLDGSPVTYSTLWRWLHKTDWGVALYKEWLEETRGISHTILASSWPDALQEQVDLATNKPGDVPYKDRIGAFRAITPLAIDAGLVKQLSVGGGNHNTNVLFNFVGSTAAVKRRETTEEPVDAEVKLLDAP